MSSFGAPRFKINALASAVAMAFVATPTIAAETARNAMLEEVTVTATRRDQSVQDIPYNITAISAQDLRNAGVGDFMKLMQTVPGVTFADGGSRMNNLNSSITLRGLSVAGAQEGAFVKGLAVPAVSTYVDETPMPLNLKLTDVQRVEVLRGPQGTLYGSGSLAGTIRFIHNKPDPSGFDGAINAGYETVSDGDPSYTVDGFVNIPVNDRVALRLSAAYEDRGGVIDAELFQLDDSGTAELADPSDFIGSAPVLRTVKDYDESQELAVRAALSVDFNDRISGLLSWHHQETDADGNAYRQVDSDRYRMSIYDGGPAAVDTTDLTADVYNLTLNADLGFAALTSSTSYTDIEMDMVRDITMLQFFLDQVATPCYIYGCFPRGPFRGDEPNERDDFTQELRLVSQGDGPFEWIVGAFYTDQEAAMILDDKVIGWAEWVHTPGSAVYVGGGPTDSFYDYFMAGYVADPLVNDNAYYTDRVVNFEETALYGEFTYHFTEQWQATFGMRAFWQDVEQDGALIFANCGVFCVPGDVNANIPASASDSVNDQIYKLNTSYQIGELTQVYATIAEGVRPGGVNAVPVGFDNITQQDLTYEGDKATNYELGLKGSLAEGRLDYTMAAFYIEWDKPQIDSYISFMGIPYTSNGGEAEVKGLELSLSGRITDAWSATLGYNYTDSELKKVGALPDNPVVGATLPNTAKNQFNFATDYFVGMGGGDLHFHLNGLYKGEAWNAIKSDHPNAIKRDSFWLVNGAVTYETGTWYVGLFSNNLFDERDAIWAGNRDGGSYWDLPARPRSLGVRVGYDF